MSQSGRRQSETPSTRKTENSKHWLKKTTLKLKRKLYKQWLVTLFAEGPKAAYIIFLFFSRTRAKTYWSKVKCQLGATR
jgi:hypothetical protein